jgi:long-subunit acyl-CoA synthetase (AMP-forming)
MLSLFFPTVGNPKGVELSHENMVSNVKGTQVQWKVGWY